MFVPSPLQPAADRYVPPEWLLSSETPLTPEEARRTHLSIASSKSPSAVRKGKKCARILYTAPPELELELRLKEVWAQEQELRREIRNRKREEMDCAPLANALAYVRRRQTILLNERERIRAGGAPVMKDWKVWTQTRSPRGV